MSWFLSSHFLPCGSERGSTVPRSQRQEPVESQGWTLTAGWGRGRWEELSDIPGRREGSNPACEEHGQADSETPKFNLQKDSS